MPTYTYRCENCGVQFDWTQKFTDLPLTVCPECSKKTLHKVYTPVGIVFKGSGFYATDHRSPSGQKFGSNAGEKTPESKAAESDSAPAASESKPAEASAPKPEKKDS